MHSAYLFRAYNPIERGLGNGKRHIYTCFFSTELKGMIVMTRLTKCEKETIILTNEKDNFWNVFTYNKALQRRFRSFAERYPENYRIKSQNNKGGMTFEIDKGRMSVV